MMDSATSELSGSRETMLPRMGLRRVSSRDGRIGVVMRRDVEFADGLGVKDVRIGVDCVCELVCDFVRRMILLEDCNFVTIRISVASKFVLGDCATTILPSDLRKRSNLNPFSPPFH